MEEILSLEIEGIIALIIGVFVVMSIIRFIKIFYKDTDLAISRIKLSQTTPKVFVLFLLSNLIYLIFGGLEAMTQNGVYGVFGIIIFAMILAYSFFTFSKIVEGKKLNLIT